MKAHFKKYRDGFTLRVSGLSKTQILKAISAIKGDLVAAQGLGQERVTMAAFDDPLPSCAPDEPRCS